ncbi:MAG: transporter substrate-binding domain-containing protein [Pseudomonadaceae bacterium]|nr:transporter substrate-binding domain-containing protein [Pseudomonadaceae bacterium]
MDKSHSNSLRRGLAGLLMSFSGTFTAAQPLVESPAPLQFVEQTDWAPFTPNTQGQTQQGLAYELLQLIFSQFERTAQLDLLPLAQVLQRAKAGQADGISVTYLDERRIGYLAYSEPLLLKRAFVYYNPNNPVPAGLLDWDSEKNMHLGVVKNRRYGPLFAQQRTQLPMALVEVDRLEQLFKFTADGTIDGFLAYELNADSLLSQPSYVGKISRMPKPYYEDAYYLAVGRHSAGMALLPQIDKAIGQLRESGQLAQLLKRYGATD